MTRSNANRVDQYRKLQTATAEFYDAPLISLISYCRTTLRMSNSQIGDVIGFDPSRVSRLNKRSMKGEK